MTQGNTQAEDALAKRVVTEQLPEFDQVIATYEEAFPADERIAVKVLIDLAERREVEFIAYYEGAQLVGFTYSVANEGYLYVVFLAVCPTIRGAGFGSRILAQLREDHPDLVHTLAIEPLDADAPNLAQRKSRLRFYERNGFSLMGYDLYEDGMRYSLLANSPAFDPDAFVSAMNTAAQGKLPVVLDKARE